MKLGQLIEYQIRKFLWKKYAENVHQKLVPESFLVLANSPKEAMHACK